MVEIDLNAEREKWDRVSELYKDEMEAVERILATEIAARLVPHVPPGGTLLEAGCGSGHLSAVLAQAGYNVTLLDFSPVAVKAARRSFEKYGIKGTILEGNLFELEKLELPEVDCVWNSGVVEHYTEPDIVHALRQMATRSRRYVMTLVPNGKSVIYRAFRQWMRRQGTWEWGQENLPESMAAFYEQAGLDVIEEAQVGGDFIGYFAQAIFGNEKVAEFWNSLLADGAIPPDQKYLLLTLGRKREPGSQPMPAAELEQKRELENKNWMIARLMESLGDEQRRIQELSALQAKAEGLRDNLAMAQQALAEQKQTFGEKLVSLSDYAEATAAQRDEAMKLEAALRQSLAAAQNELDPLRFEVRGLRDNLAMVQQALVEQKKACEERVLIFSDYAAATAAQRDEALRAEAAARQSLAEQAGQQEELKIQIASATEKLVRAEKRLAAIRQLYRQARMQPHQPEHAADPVAEMLAEKIQKARRRIDELEMHLAGLDGETQRAKDEAARQKRLREDMERQVQDLSRQYEALYLKTIALENAQRESTKEIGEARLEAAHAKDVISKLNHALTYCQNRSWELMTKVEHHLTTRDYVVGKYFGLLMRDKTRSIGVLARWIAARLTRRPFSIARELNADYPLHDVEGGLKSLAFFARDAGRQTAGLAVVTPTSMADHAFPLSRYKEPDLIVYSITSWSFREQRPQHLVRGLVARHCRAFVMPTDTIGLKDEFPTDAQIGEKMIVRRLEDDIWEVIPCSFNALNIYKDNLSDPRDLKILKRSLALLRAKFGIGHHVGLVQLPFWGPLAQSLAGGRVIYDCMDNHSDFSTNAEGMLSQEDELMKGADAVLVSSRYLEHAAGDKPKARYLVRNACEYDYFSQPPEQLAPAMAAIEGPVIGYYGAISDWFDSDLVLELAKRRPDWQFVLIGHTFGADIEGLKALPNVHMPGEVRYKTLTSFLYRFDVCIIPFKLTELIKATNPVKIYEYSAAGKPTVATRIPELEELGDLVDLADDAAGFEKAIEARLADSDKAARAERLRAFARENTWARRVDQLALAIREHAWPRVSVVVLSYGEWSVTRDCIESILNETTYPNFELIVIDNASGEETRNALSAIDDARLRVVFNDVNRGYAGGNNQGMRLAEGDIIILLNNDTVCPPDWIQSLVRVFEEDPKTGLAGPMTNSAGNEQMLDVTCTFGQDQFHWLQEFHRIRRGERHESDRLGFFCVAIRRAAHESIGDLDEAFGIGYFEDDDYCARALEAGWKLTVVEDAFVFHKGSVSFNALDDEEKQKIFETNRVLFEKKHGRPWTNPICERMYFDEEEGRDANRPTALIAPGYDWNAPVHRPQQIALALVRNGWRVYYVSNNLSSNRYLGIRLLRPGLYAVENRPEWVEEILKQNIDLFYSFGGPGEAMRERAGARMTIVDFDANPYRGDWQWDPRSEAARAVAGEAAVITISHECASMPAEWRDKAFVLPTGIEVDNIIDREPILPPEGLSDILAKADGPVIAIVSPMDDSVDWAWLENIVHSMHALTFVHLQTNQETPRRADWPAVFNLRNIQPLGYVPYGRRADYLRFVSAVLGPRAAGDNQACSSSYLLEALATGRPVITGRLFDDPALNPFVIPVSTPDEMEPAIQEAIRRSNDPAHLKRCRAAIENYDWKRNVGRLIERVGPINR